MNCENRCTICEKDFMFLWQSWVFHFDISVCSQNGALSAIPYIGFWAFINIGGNIADALRSRGWKTKHVRKISLCMGRFKRSHWINIPVYWMPYLIFAIIHILYYSVNRDSLARTVFDRDRFCELWKSFHCCSSPDISSGFQWIPGIHI